MRSQLVLVPPYVLAVPHVVASALHLMLIAYVSFDTPLIFFMPDAQPCAVSAVDQMSLDTDFGNVQDVIQ